MLSVPFQPFQLQRSQMTASRNSIPLIVPQLFKIEKRRCTFETEAAYFLSGRSTVLTGKDSGDMIGQSTALQTADHNLKG